jgi:hypothetical protein
MGEADLRPINDSVAGALDQGKQFRILRVKDYPFDGTLFSCQERVLFIAAIDLPSGSSW